MVQGCRNPNAVNYNPAADTEDYSCIYLFKHGMSCFKFIDVLPGTIVDNSFTMSYSLSSQSWVFFHTYQPDMYIHTRNSLYSLKGNTFFKHHEGAPGQFFNTSPDSFFIDVIFREGGEKEADTDILLETINWISEYLPASGRDQMFSTITHIAVWNSQQHTGRIALANVLPTPLYDTNRRTKGEWSFNELRDSLITGSGSFIGNLFSNFAIDNGQVEPFPVWYEQGPLQDKWMCVRFEYDNSINAKLILHDVSVTAQISNR